jgi:hypothetical protein
MRSEYWRAIPMGVDFFPCDHCGESICDCGDYWCCEECGHRLCTDCAKEHDVEGWDDEEDEAINNCPYCKNDMATDSDLLDFALYHLEVTREELMEKYRIHNAEGES